MKSLAGIFTALLTPFDRDGKVDEAGLRKLVSTGIAKGIDGFYVCGSTGEAFLLKPEERMRVLDIVTEEAAGRVTIIAHIGSIGTDLSIDLGRHAAAAGADAISSIPPFYYKFSAEEVLGYYRDIADTIDLPVIPYNFPALSGVNLTGELVGRLREQARIAAVKFTSSDLFQLERMKKENPGLIVLNGFDEICLGGLAMGADGAIGSTFNFMPEKFLGIRERFAAGDMAGARALQEGANEVIQILLGTGKLLNAHKFIMGLQGIPCGECRRPFLPLTAADRAKLEDVARRRLILNA